MKPLCLCGSNVFTGLPVLEYARSAAKTRGGAVPLRRSPALDLGCTGSYGGAEGGRDDGVLTLT
jgi:hypothetical protein